MTRVVLSLCLAFVACSHNREPLPGAEATGPKPAAATSAPNALALELRIEGSPAFLTPADIARCASERDAGNALLHCTLTAAGKDKLAQVTGANVGKVMEMLVEGTVRMRPQIQQAITGGELTMWMGDDAKAAADADRLAAALSRH